MAYIALNPNSCNPVINVPGVQFQVYNNSGGYTAPALAKGVLTLIDDTTDTNKEIAINYNSILYGGQGYSVITTTAGTAKIQTVTIGTITTLTAPNTLIYGVSIGYKASCNSGQVVIPYNYVAQSTDTANSIAAAIAANITADPNAVVTCTASTNVLTITAKAAGNDFQATGSPNMTTATSTANVNPSGNNADLLAMGVPGALLASGATYWVVTISYNGFQANSLAQPDAAGRNLTPNQLVLFIQTGGAAESAILTGTNGLNNIMLVDVAGAFTLPSYFGH